LGQIFAGSLRDSDYVARTGGEEFCFVLTQTHIEDGLLFADRLRETVQDHKFEYKGVRVDIRLSGGITAIEDLVNNPVQQEGPPGQSMLILADYALYAAKRGGRNQIVRYTTNPLATTQASDP
jgi:diguanylate cyclase (GGDEF)-like protein